jgi:hypothetical protein
MNRLLTSVVSLALTLPVLAAAEPPTSATVDAGKFARTATVFTVKVPDTVDADSRWELRDKEQNVSVPLQVLPGGGRAVMDAPRLNAGESRPLTLVKVTQSSRPDVGLRREGTAVTFLAGKQEMFRYNGEKTPLPAGFDPSYQRGGYIWPIYTPSGTLVSDDYPPMHKHHHGVWTPWTKTEFEGRHPDFWNMGDKTGTVEFVGLVSTFTGPVAAGLQAKHRFVDLSAKPKPKTVLNETWDVMAYAPVADVRPYFMFDLTSTQTCATDQPLILPKYHYGGFGYRGHRTWDGKGNCEFLTSEGKTRADGNETRGRWVYVYGKVDGKTAGVAILCHPENFRAPQPIRIHPTEPYISYAPQQMGEFRIEPGKPYVSRYRVVAMDGGPDKELLDRLWNDYATPPEVTFR